MTLLEIYQACQALLIRGVDPETVVIVQVAEDESSEIYDDVLHPFYHTYNDVSRVVINARESGR